MTYSTTNASLVGCLRPVGAYPAFAVPVFRERVGANTLLVQELDESAVVAGFNPIDYGQAQIHPSAPRELKTGEAPLFAFSVSDDTAIIDTREALTTFFDGNEGLWFDRPFLALQIVEFCGWEKTRLFEARSRAFETLRDRSQFSAEFWRNAVVLLPIIRNNIRKAVGEKQSDRWFSQIADVELAVKKNSATITLPSPLANALSLPGHSPELTLLRGVRDAAAAFGIGRFTIRERKANVPFIPAHHGARYPRALSTLILPSGPQSQAFVSSLVRSGHKRHPNPIDEWSHTGPHSLGADVFETAIQGSGAVATSEIKNLAKHISHTAPIWDAKFVRPLAYQSLKTAIVVFDHDKRSFIDALTIARHYSSLGCDTIGLPINGRLDFEQRLKGGYYKTTFDSYFDIGNAFNPLSAAPANKRKIELVHHLLRVAGLQPSDWLSKEQPSWLVVGASASKSPRRLLVSAADSLKSESLMPSSGTELFAFLRNPPVASPISLIQSASETLAIEPTQLKVAVNKQLSTGPTLILLAKVDQTAASADQSFERFCEWLLKTAGWHVESFQQPSLPRLNVALASRNGVSRLIQYQRTLQSIRVLQGSAIAQVVLTGSRISPENAWSAWADGICVLHYSDLEDIDELDKHQPPRSLVRLLLDQDKERIFKILTENFQSAVGRMALSLLISSELARSRLPLKAPLPYSLDFQVAIDDTIKTRRKVIVIGNFSSGARAGHFSGSLDASGLRVEKAVLNRAASGSRRTSTKKRSRRKSAKKR